MIRTGYSGSPKLSFAKAVKRRKEAHKILHSKARITKLNSQRLKNAKQILDNQELNSYIDSQLYYRKLLGLPENFRLTGNNPANDPRVWVWVPTPHIQTKVLLQSFATHNPELNLKSWVIKSFGQKMFNGRHYLISLSKSDLTKLKETGMKLNMGSSVVANVVINY